MPLRDRNTLNSALLKHVALSETMVSGRPCIVLSFWMVLWMGPSLPRHLECASTTNKNMCPMNGPARDRSNACGIVWWPGLDADVEAKVKGCQQCQENQKNMPTTMLEVARASLIPVAHGHCGFGGVAQVFCFDPS